MRAGNVHNRPDSVEEGGLALFCPACPQIGINTGLETEWKPEDQCVSKWCFVEIKFTNIFQAIILAPNCCGWEHEMCTSSDEMSR